jgi:hypothetical protein
MKNDIRSNYTKDQLTCVAAYMWSVFHATRTPVPSNDTALEVCWISTFGDIIKGRCMINYRGVHYYNYCFNATIMYGQPKHKWSHLCNNKLCERPSHLVDEDPKTSDSRSNCAGIVYDEKTKQVFVLCHHEPRCKHVHLLGGGITVDMYKT